MRKCKNCGSEIPKEAEYCCENCGQPIEFTMAEKFAKTVEEAVSEKGVLFIKDDTKVEIIDPTQGKGLIVVKVPPTPSNEELEKFSKAYGDPSNFSVMIPVDKKKKKRDYTLFFKVLVSAIFYPIVFVYTVIRDLIEKSKKKEEPIQRIIPIQYPTSYPVPYEYPEQPYEHHGGWSIGDYPPITITTTSNSTDADLVYGGSNTHTHHDLSNLEGSYTVEYKR